MKKIMTLLATMIVVTAVYSQSSLSFCTSVEKDGACNSGNTKFISAPDSSLNRVFMRVKSDNAFGISGIAFKVYSVEKNGTEKLDIELPQAVQPDWMFAWQPCYFPTGKYIVKVFTDKDKFLCSQTIEFFDWNKF